MYRLLFLAIACIAVGGANAQKIRFTDTTNQWNVLTGCTCDPPPNNQAVATVSYYGQVTIGGSVYKRMKTFGSPYIYIYNGLIREDTIAKKVYFRAEFPHQNIPYPDTLEHLLYDYNRVVGDSVIVPLANGIAYRHYVSAIDSVLINNQWHKVWSIENSHAQGVGGTQPYKVIEGIGCLDYPLFPIYPFQFEAGFILRCFHQGGTQPMPSPSVGYFDNGSSCSLAVGDVSDVRTGIKVVPSPATALSKILLPKGITHGQLTIVNGAGQVVARAAFNNASTLDLPSEVGVPGLYFYRVINAQTGQEYSGSFSLK